MLENYLCLTVEEVRPKEAAVRYMQPVQEWLQSPKVIMNKRVTKKTLRSS